MERIDQRNRGASGTIKTSLSESSTSGRRIRQQIIERSNRKDAETIVVNRLRKRLGDNVPGVSRSKASKTGKMRPPQQGYIEIEVELPHGTMDITRRTFWVPGDAKTITVKNQLAKHFGVSEDSWNLFTSHIKGETPTILDTNKEINQYSREKSRLYFYPKIIF